MMTATERRAILLRRDDDVALAVRPIPKGALVEVGDQFVEAREPIALGHKLAVRNIAVGEPVRKYGQVIGFASKEIPRGSWVHVQNVKAELFDRDYAFATELPPAPPEIQPRTFLGYLRPDGRVGTRNYVAVISTVNCSASTSKFIADRFRDGAWKSEFPNVDGVIAITHKGGCSMPEGGGDHQALERVLSGFANHPNVAACVVVGLGCEVNGASRLIESQDLVMIGSKTRQRPRVLNIQEQGGISRTVEAAVQAVREILPQANAWKRTEQPASKIHLAMECGGSDGNSGVTANPALGVAADLIVAQGGTAVLGETPEIYGAEHLLTRRAVSAAVGEKLIAKIRWWEWYTGLFGAEINNNPSPGNKDGGLTTIYEKSLGALAKAGTSPLVDVVAYAEKVDTPGLVFMDTPGNDPVCTTGLVAGGANVLVFTTGRGSVLGLKPTPCIKVSTNTPMYQRMSADMDMDAGTILDGEPVEAAGHRMFDLILDVASGRKTRSELEGVGEEEFALWHFGPDALKRHFRTAPLVVILIFLPVLEAAWVGWWLVAPLPNARTIDDKPMRRGWILLRALPEIVPDVTFQDSHLGQVLRELSHVENLPQRLPILLAGGLIAGAGLSLGGWILRGLQLSPSLTLFERVPLAFGLGMIALGTITLILGRLGLLNGWAMRIGLGGVLASGLWGRFATLSEEKQRRTSILPLVAFAMIVGPFLVMMAMASMLPTTDYDAIEYHLQGPKEYDLNGKIAFLPHNVYTSMPFGVEMLHLLGMVVLGDWWRGALVGQFLVMLHAPAAGAMIYLAASRWGSPRAGWFAAVAYLTTPWVFRLAAIPYVEGPLAYYHAALIWAAGWAMGQSPSSMRPWGIVGALAGGAMTCKYPALISAVIPFGCVALASRTWRAVVGFGLGLTIAIGPWLVKNVVDTGNPVYPLGYGVFGGRDWNPDREAKWRNAHGPKPPSWKALADNLIDVGGRSDWQSALFVSLAPLAFLRRGSHRITLVLWAYVSYLFATWWFLTHRLDRFWLPMLPPLAILAGLGADWTRKWAWRALLTLILVVVIVTNFFYSTSALTAFNKWTGDLDVLRTSVPKHVNPPLQKLDEILPPNAKPLLVGQAAVFHMKHPVVYNTVFNEEIFETLAKGRSPQEVRKALLDRGITHVYVDWVEVIRHSKPGGYGFTPFIVPEVFERLVAAKVLEPIEFTRDGHDLYRVR